MIIDTVEARFLEEGDFIIIDGMECVVRVINDEGETFVITYQDDFNDLVTEEFPWDFNFEIWGN